MPASKTVAIIGSGPAALMAADLISAQGMAVAVFEKKKGPGRKLLIAGSSGLNISNSQPVAEFARHYSGAPYEYWLSLLTEFSPQDWIRFIEDLGLATFEGTSGRYFVRDMKASKLLRAWLNRLDQQGVRFHFNHELRDFDLSSVPRGIRLEFSAPQEAVSCDAVCFCLGGGSYEPTEDPLRWPSIFTGKGFGFTPFTPSNVGYQIDWKPEFLKEAEGLPLKNIVLASSKGSRKGDVVVTRYGLEGTPVYFMGETGEVFLDLKPDLSHEQLLRKCLSVKENLSPIRRVSRQLKLAPAALALLFHHASREAKQELESLLRLIKRFPLQFIGSQSLRESISSAGGLHLSELNERMMLLKAPGCFAAGEMLDWDAPTGGFLIQGSVSQAHRAAHGILAYLKS